MGNDSRVRNNEETMATATARGLLWGSDEEAYLEEHLEDLTIETALTLDRTFEGIQQHRQAMKLRREKQNGKRQYLTELLTLEEADQEREELKVQGIAYPTIMSIPGTGKYRIMEGRAA